VEGRIHIYDRDWIYVHREDSGAAAGSVEAEGLGWGTEVPAGADTDGCVAE